MSKIAGYVAMFNTVVTVGMNCAPGLSFIEKIRNKKPISEFPASVLIFNILCNETWACYWLRKRNFQALPNNVICTSIGILLSIVYLFFRAEKKVLNWLLYDLVAASFIYNFYTLFGIQLPLDLAGTIIVIINIATYAAPAQNIYIVLKEYKLDLIPLPSTLFGLVCSAGWFLYGFLINDINVLIPNAIGLFFSVITISVYIYVVCKTGGSKKEDKQGDYKEMKENEQP